MFRHLLQRSTREIRENGLRRHKRITHSGCLVTTPTDTITSAAAVTAAAAAMAITMISSQQQQEQQQQHQHQEQQQHDHSSVSRNDNTMRMFIDTYMEMAHVHCEAHRHHHHHHPHHPMGRLQREHTGLQKIASETTGDHSHHSPPGPSSSFATQKTELHDLEKRYEINWNEPIGEGAFGFVYEGTCHKTRQKVAIKVMSKDLTSIPAFQQEMDALLLLKSKPNHPNICNFIENYETQHDFVIIFDYIDGRELFDQLLISGTFTENQAAHYIKQVVEGLQFLHETVGLVHADIKPENLIFTSKRIWPSSSKNGNSTANQTKIKIVDFGNAQPIKQSHKFSLSFSSTNKEDKRQRVMAKSPSYCPPEVLAELQNTKDGLAHINPSFDMWSLGIVLYILLVGMHPFDPKADATDEEFERRILSGIKPPGLSSPVKLAKSKSSARRTRNHNHNNNDNGDGTKTTTTPRRFTRRRASTTSQYTRHLSDDAIEIMRGLLEEDPQKRLTAQQVLNHPWIRNKTTK